MVLHEVSNMAYLGNNLIRDGIRELEKFLPETYWSLTLMECNAKKTGCVNNQLKITSPDGKSFILNIVSRKQIQPRDVKTMVSICRCLPCTSLLVIAPFLSTEARSCLQLEGINYLDLTGNADIRIISPAIWIQATGASKNPCRKARSSRSLKGLKAGRIVQILVDHRETSGVRELASKAGTDVGYVSRVLKFLDEQALIIRGEKGRLRQVDREALLRRWAEDAPIKSRGEIRKFIDPRGLDSLMRKLENVDFCYAVSGSFAVAQTGPIAPPRLAMIYVKDIDEASSVLNLRQVTTGVNVLLIRPYDEWIFARSEKVGSIYYTAFSQAVVDLLTSPGRAPAEAEEMFKWMKEQQEFGNE
jgi:hypothetical protein